MGKGKGKMSIRHKRQALYGSLYILPSFAVIMVFNVLAIFLTAYFSLTSYDVYNSPKFIGINNYINLFQNKTFKAAMVNTVKYVIITVPIQTIIALVIAAFLAEKLKNKYGAFLRSIMFIPVIVSAVAASAVWKIIFKTKGGVINQFLELVGMSGVNWLGSKSMAFISVCIVSIWKNIGYFLVIYYAGIMGISQELYEAARVDGATSFQRFRYITLPGVKPITYMVLTLGIIWSFQVFDIVYQLTGGGPGTATITLAYMIYTYAFSNQKMGYASAIAIVLLLFVIAINRIQDLFFKEKEV